MKENSLCSVKKSLPLVKSQFSCHIASQQIVIMAFIDVTESNGFIGLLCSFIGFIIISFMSIHFLKVIAELPSTPDNIWWKFPNKSGLVSFISLVFYAAFELHIFVNSVYWLSVKNTGRFSSYWCLSLWYEFNWYTIGKATMYLFWIFRSVLFILYEYTV